MWYTCVTASPPSLLLGKSPLLLKGSVKALVEGRPVFEGLAMLQLVRMNQYPMPLARVLPEEHGNVEFATHQQVLVQLHPELPRVLLLNPVADDLSILMVASAATVLYQQVVRARFLTPENGFEADHLLGRIP